MTTEFYKIPDVKVRPGDIVSLGPTFRALKDVVHVGSEQTAKGGQITAKLLGKAGSGAEAPSADVREGRTPTKFVVPGILSWAILLTRGCDIDNAPQRQLALIRPLSLLGDVKIQEAVMDDKHSSLCYMPKPKLAEVVVSDFDEAFVDFRYIVTLHAEAFDKLHRPLALTRGALLNLYFGWMRHTIGPQAHRIAPCPGCGRDIEVFQVVDEFLTPQPDY